MPRGKQVRYCTIKDNIDLSPVLTEKKYHKIIGKKFSGI